MTSETARADVCYKYRVYLNKQFKLRNKAIVEELFRLKDIFLKYGKLELLCWCAPKQCHAETIKKAVIYLLNK